ncbi:gp53-like domain-containing protein [Pectobacterium quasiaquaticum]|uniref:gp53-like domain-containing protein n=1 Tax=Pectobacterium quasiaquaticum TaxID=2774015 RepID=UPI003D3684CB
MIVQWGVSTEGTNVFSVPFPAQCFSLTATLKRTSSPWDGSVTAAYIISKSEFYVGVGTPNSDPIYWIAIGN